MRRVECRVHPEASRALRGWLVNSIASSYFDGSRTCRFAQAVSLFATNLAREVVTDDGGHSPGSSPQIWLLPHYPMIAFGARLRTMTGLSPRSRTEPGRQLIVPVTPRIRRPSPGHDEVNPSLRVPGVSMSTLITIPTTMPSSTSFPRHPLEPLSAEEVRAAVGLQAGRQGDPDHAVRLGIAPANRTRV